MGGEYKAVDFRDILARDLLIGNAVVLVPALTEVEAIAHCLGWLWFQVSETDMMPPFLSVSVEGVVSGRPSFAAAELLTGDISWFSSIETLCTRCDQVDSCDKGHQHPPNHILFSGIDTGDMPGKHVFGLASQGVYHCPVLLVAVLLTCWLTRLHLWCSFM